MKKAILLSIFILGAKFQAFSQLIEGDLFISGRKITSEFPLTIAPSTYEGKITFSIAVNEYGNVTSAKVIENRSEINSTPARIKAANLIYNIKFEAGTHFPKYHNGIYQVIFKKN